MSRPLQVRAEILKLARLLGRDPESLGYLEDVAPTDIRQLREQVTDLLFSADGTTLARLAAASKLLPVGLVATIGQRAFGPVLSARVAGMIEPDRAIEMAAMMPVEFLADIAVEIDPRRAGDVIGRVPPEQVAQITAVLARREEYVTMGRFVDFMAPEAITAALGVLDDRALLQVAFVLESKDSLNELVSLLTGDRVDGIIDAAAQDDLWPEALDLVGGLENEQQAEFARRIGTRPTEVLESMLAAVDQLGLWEELRPLEAHLRPEARERTAAARARAAR
jgi:hypothetical protein